ncbi:ATP-binding response regulator [Pseudomonas kurunegalensis]|uniref:ATP-binding response regulator n=1 Tax=Pseudomonas kurunegalensis TaxID=485880 RepID=UPI0025713278|nr:hybrid sensor histidine kinase/response regulator [Pseudomonas kurunegalensis]WJD60328.1 hybrid sensor histidine kinase/response regulator [Pseudomonas kurunegalensis]
MIKDDLPGEGPQDLDQASGIRVEQVRQVFEGMKNSLYLGLGLSVILVIALDSPQRRWQLLAWLGLVTVGRVVCVVYAIRALKVGITPGNAQRLIRHMCLIKVFEGFAWGALTWIEMGQGSLPEQLLVMASLAGVSGNAVSLLAPVFPLYASMQLTQLLVINTCLVMIEGGAYNVLAIGCTLFVAGQYGQARIAQRASAQSIALRFENLNLVGRLQQALNKAEEANQAKSKFLAAASHDLRQPVHAQELFLEVLASSELSEVQSKVLGNARAASQAAAQMLNILLDFSRIEAGVIEPQRCTFLLQPLLHKLEIELGGQADAKGIVYRSRETLLAVESDPALLELMLRNLITNAIRYTERGGVLIGCRRRGDHALIEVVDTGIGIDVAHQAAIFREFHQLGNPERDRTKGLGLGLAITDGLATSLKHDMSLVSEPGRGSIFRISVPLAQRCTIDYAPNSQEVLADYGAPMQGLCVLVIDDDLIVRQAMEHLLSDWGCDCRTEERMDDAALQRLAGWPLQVVISDFRLRDEQTGADAIHKVRTAFGATLPALLITGDTAPERLREARASGIPLLHKPVSPRQLHQALASRASAQ